jgi:hypothetical protein
MPRYLIATDFDSEPDGLHTYDCNFEWNAITLYTLKPQLCLCDDKETP